MKVQIHLEEIINQAANIMRERYGRILSITSIGPDYAAVSTSECCHMIQRIGTFQGSELYQVGLRGGSHAIINDDPNAIAALINGNA